MQYRRCRFRFVAQIGGRVAELSESSNHHDCQWQSYIHSRQSPLRIQSINCSINRDLNDSGKILIKKGSAIFYTPFNHFIKFFYDFCTRFILFFTRRANLLTCCSDMCISKDIFTLEQSFDFNKKYCNSLSVKLQHSIRKSISALT